VYHGHPLQKYTQPSIGTIILPEPSYILELAMASSSPPEIPLPHQRPTVQMWFELETPDYILFRFPLHYQPRCRLYKFLELLLGDVSVAHSLTLIRCVLYPKPPIKSPYNRFDSRITRLHTNNNSKNQNLLASKHIESFLKECGYLDRCCLPLEQFPSTRPTP
jgi:hypothetical protein